MSNRYKNAPSLLHWLLIPLTLTLVTSVLADRLPDLRSDDVKKFHRTQLLNQAWRDLITGFKLAGGYNFNFRSGGDDGGYYQITYNGQLLSSTAPALAVWTTQKIPEEQQYRTDLLDLPAESIRIEDGTLYDNGTLFFVEGLRRVKRGGARGGGREIGTGLRFTNDDELGRHAIAVSIESTPKRLPNRDQCTTPNWLTLGLRFDHAQYSEGMGEDTSWGSLTYRAAWMTGWHTMKPPRSFSKQWSRIIQQAATAYAEQQNKSLEAMVESAAPNTVFAMMSDLRRQGQGILKNDDLLRGVANQIAETDDAFYQLRLEISDEGSYAFLGTPDTNRFANLFSASLTWYPINSNQEAYLQARYELGNDPASPTERKNILMLSANLKF